MDDETTIDLEDVQRTVQENYDMENIAVGVGASYAEAQDRITDYLTEMNNVQPTQVAAKYFEPDEPADTFCDRLDLPYSLEEDDVVLVARYRIDRTNQPAASGTSTSTIRTVSPGSPGDVESTPSGSGFSSDRL